MPVMVASGNRTSHEGVSEVVADDMCKSGLAFAWAKHDAARHVVRAVASYMDACGLDAPGVWLSSRRARGPTAPTGSDMCAFYSSKHLKVICFVT